MKTVRKVQLTAEFVEYIPEELKQNVLYVSNEYATAVHLCLCGCGNKSVTPLNRNGWYMLYENDTITLAPSILNTNCPNRAHYVITNNIANILER